MKPDLRLGGTRTSHRWAEMPGNWDRLNTRAIYPSGNSWGIPDLPIAESRPARLVAYNNRSAVATAGIDDAVHFFLDDYRFETMWSKPERGLSRVRSVGWALTPDFSLWADMPLVMQLWQVYRSRWCGAWMLQHGIDIIPTVSWSTPATYDFAFAGIARHSTVAISTVGLRRAPAEARVLFTAGYREMLDRCQPARVVVYGQAPPDLVPMGPPVHSYPTRWEK